MKHIDEQTLAILKEKLEAEKVELEADLARIGMKVDGENDWAAKMPELDETEEDPNTQADRFSELYRRGGELNSLEGRLQEVVAAIEAMAAGNYGVTAEGEEIPVERLMVNPAASTLVK